MAKTLHNQIAARAREIISDRERWIQGQLAVSDDARSVDPTDARAHRFCAVAALRRAAHEVAPGQNDLADLALRSLSSRWCTFSTRSSVTAWRTSTTTATT